MATPNVTYCYDGQIYQNGSCVAAASRGGAGAASDAPKGLLTGYGSQVDGGDAAQNFLQIDPLGRTLKSVQRMKTTSTEGVKDFPFVYAYEASGSMTSLTYPEGRKVDYTYGSLRDNLTEVKSGFTSYLSGLRYESLGGLKSASVGTGFAETRTIGECVACRWP